MLDFEAAIFDLDGTLVDSMYVWDKVDLDFLKKRNLKVTDNYQDNIRGKRPNEIAEYTIELYNLSDTPEDLVKEWTDLAFYEYEHNVKLKPNVLEYLNYLKKNGKKLAIATATQMLLCETVLKSNGIYEMFDTLSSADEVGFGKFNPAVYLHTAGKLGIAPKNCIVFEDVIEGVRGALLAGMKVYGVYDEKSKSIRDEMIQIADGYIHNFSELMQEEAWD